MPTLRQNAYKLMRELQFRGDVPVRELSDRIGMSTHRIGRVLDQLASDGVIHHYVEANYASLGFESFCVLFRYSALGLSRSIELEARLRTIPGVGWVMPLLGNYDLAIVLSVLEVGMLHSTLSSLDPYGTLFRAVEISRRLSYNAFERIYEDPSSRRRREVCFDYSRVTPVTSELRRTVEVWSRYPQATLGQLSDLLQAPRSTVHHRLLQLRTSGIVHRMAGLRTNALQSLAYRIIGRLRYDEPGLRMRLTEFCRNSPSVTGIAHWVGAWHMMIVIEAKEPSHFSRWWAGFRGQFAGQLRDVEILGRFDVTNSPAFDA